MARPVLFTISAITILVLVALILPPAASALLLNRANADIARVTALPPDSPSRVTALADADVQLNQARGLSDLPRVALAQMRVLLARDDPRRAAEAMRSSGAALQNDTITQFVWGTAEWQAANPVAAFERWRAAGAIDFFVNESNRARDRHQWQDAAGLARLAVGIAPDRADAHYVLGDAISHLNINDPAALREIDRAAELTRDNELASAILSRKGELLAAQGKYAVAFDVFEQAMQIAPLDARPRTAYARILLQLQPDARDRAEEMLKQSITIAPWDTAAFTALAEIAESWGDSKRAEDWYLQGLARNVNDAGLLFALGEFYARQNRLDEAKTTLILALKYETRADDLQKIADALVRLGSQ